MSFCYTYKDMRQPSSALRYQILAGLRPGYKYVLYFATKTKTPVESWLDPENLFNPFLPFRYQGQWPPSLSHLQGEALNLAHQILESFPERPPSLEEWKAFRRHLRKSLRKIFNGGK